MAGAHSLYPISTPPPPPALPLTPTLSLPHLPLAAPLAQPSSSPPNLDLSHPTEGVNGSTVSLSLCLPLPLFLTYLTGRKG